MVHAGLWALHHIAVHAPVAELRQQRDLLLHTAQHAIVGADERVWQAASLAAVSMVIALEGKLHAVTLKQPCCSAVALVSTDPNQPGFKHGKALCAGMLARS